MSTNINKVPFGYEPPKEELKGTLIYYDSFEDTTDEDLELAAEVAVERSFAKLVLYPLHDETVRRMSKIPVSAYFKREDRLHEWKREKGGANVIVERLEGKRKKYTPIDSALRHFQDKYPSPYFLYVTGETANMFASYSSFEEWIVKIRLILTSEPLHVHPRLEKFRHRWNAL